MFRFRLLPWDYGVRNLGRRPARTSLTLAALTLVVFLVFIIVSFIRGLEVALATSGDPQVVLVYAQGAEANIENSAIEASVPGVLAANLSQIQRRYGMTHLSPELFFGTRVSVGESDRSTLGLVRGVTTAAPLVRRQVRLVEGAWPVAGELLVGRLAAAKLGVTSAHLAPGSTVHLEGRAWRVSGTFAAAGSALEAELWCPLTDLQQAARRNDLTLAALLLAPEASPARVDLFCKKRLDLALQSRLETEYYAALQQHYRPVRWVAWFVALLVSAAGMFAGLNTMYGAVAGRVRELAMLQAIGFRRRALLLSLVQEGTLLAAAASLLAALLALTFVNGAAVRFTMGAFALRVDGIALLVGSAAGLMLGILGSLPPALVALRLNVSENLKAI